MHFNLVDEKLLVILFTVYFFIIFREKIVALV